MNPMPDSAPDPVASPQPATPTSTPPSRTGARLKVGVPTVIALVAVGSAPFVFDTGGDDAVVQSIGVTTTTTTTTTGEPGDDSSDPIFTSAGATSVSAPLATTTTRPTTTVRSSSTTTANTPTTAPTTVMTTVPETLPAQPTAPIDPPADPRGFEEQVRLGGISIPKLGLDAPLLEGIRLTTLDNGPGHWPGTALPGEVGNVVVAAHRTSHGGPFRNIDQLIEGDVVLFDTDDGEVEYTVTGTQIVEPDAIWIVDPTDTATATLFACHPPGSVAQRIVVKLELAA